MLESRTGTNPFREGYLYELLEREEPRYLGFWETLEILLEYEDRRDRATPYQGQGVRSRGNVRWRSCNSGEYRCCRWSVVDVDRDKCRDVIVLLFVGVVLLALRFSGSRQM